MGLSREELKLLERAGTSSGVRMLLLTELGLTGQRCDLVVRFGRGPTLPPSLRRPVESVMV